MLSVLLLAEWIEHHVAEKLGLKHESRSVEAERQLSVYNSRQSYSHNSEFVEVVILQHHQM